MNPPPHPTSPNPPLASERPISHVFMTWIKRALVAALTGYWSLIFILTHLPPAEVPAVSINDKIEHFLAYGMLGGLLFLTLWALRPHQRRLGWIVWMIGLSYGAIDEWLQILVGRDCELNDWLADAIAVTIAVLVLSLVRWAVNRRFTRPAPDLPA